MSSVFVAGLAAMCGASVVTPAGPLPAAADPPLLAGLGGWTHLGGDAQHRGRAAAPSALPPLADPRWVVSEDHLGRPILFLSPAGVVTDEARVYAVGTIAGADHLIAADRFTGAVAWATPVPDAAWDSWSTPAVDVRNGTVLVASGARLTAVGVATGAVVWQATLNHAVVNASPVVTSDLGARNRAFITDAPLTAATPGRLYCVNVDPFDAGANPHQPGEVVWSAPLEGLTSGNTPAYRGGRVYTASAGAPPFYRGKVFAFDARSASAPAPEWTFTNPVQAGFFGGVGVAQGSVLVSSFAFNGDHFSANTCRLDARTGALLWSAPSNRTDATPVLAGGMVLVSSGLPEHPSLPSFGSFPTVQAFDAQSGSLLWDLALDTWHDQDQDGAMDQGEFLEVGGWSHHPVAVNTGAVRALVVGSPPRTSDPLGPYGSLWAIDLDWNPAAEPQPPILDVSHSAGSTPAHAGGWIYSVGPDGLHAFGPGTPG